MTANCSASSSPMQVGALANPYADVDKTPAGSVISKTDEVVRLRKFIRTTNPKVGEEQWEVEVIQGDDIGKIDELYFVASMIYPATCYLNVPAPAGAKIAFFMSVDPAKDYKIAVWSAKTHAKRNSNGHLVCSCGTINEYADAPPSGDYVCGACRSFKSWG